MHAGTHVLCHHLARIVGIVQRHDHLGDPALHAGEATGQGVRLVPGNDHDGERQRGGHGTVEDYIFPTSERGI